MVIALVVIASAGCDRGGDAAQAPTTTIAAIPTDDATTTTTTVAPTTTAAARGATQIYETHDGEGRAEITVLRYRANATRPEYRDDEETRYSAIEVRVCVRKAPEGAVSVSWDPWSLTDDQDQTFLAADSWSADTLVGPLYPQYRETRVGSCRRGWVPFELPDDAKPTTVEYNTGEGSILTWPIKA